MGLYFDLFKWFQLFFFSFSICIAIFILIGCHDNITHAGNYWEVLHAIHYKVGDASFNGNFKHSVCVCVLNDFCAFSFLLEKAFCAFEHMSEFSKKKNAWWANKVKYFSQFSALLWEPVNSLYLILLVGLPVFLLKKNRFFNDS